MKTHLRWAMVNVIWGMNLLVHAATPPKPEPGLHVSVVLFCGREDPKFVITDAREIAEVLASVRGLPRHASLDSASSLPHPMFGFRGVIIRNFSSQGPEIGFVHVFGNDVEAIEKAAPAVVPVRSFRFDADAALQQRLLGMARARGVYPPR